MVFTMNSKQIKKKKRIIQTPWGEISPQVDLFPLLYILILYGVIYFLPLGIFEGWRKGEDGPAEWLQFLGYISAFLSSLIVLWRRRGNIRTKQYFFWFLICLLTFYIAGEEISWGERLTSIGIESLRRLNAQGETNLHNLDYIQNYLHFSFISSGLFFGWFGWKLWPKIDAFPSKRYSLYFLFVALFYTYWDLSWITLGERIRNDQEAIEVLMSLGLFLHCFNAAKGRESGPNLITNSKNQTKD